MNKLNSLKQLIVVFLLFATITIVGCAGTNKTESTGEYFDDSSLTIMVKTAIFNDSELKVFQINVETFKSEVQLSGFVDSIKIYEKAEKVTKSVKGVKGVKNSIIIK